MNTIRTAIIATAAAVVMAGCEIADPMIIAVGLPLEVSAEVNSGNSWNETDTFVIEDEIASVDVSYIDDVRASRVNDITITMVDPQSAGTSSGSVSYAIDGGTVVQLATWSNLPLSALAAPGVSVLDESVLTVNLAARQALLDALQDTSGLPLASSFTVQTSGTTSVTVPGGTKIVAQLHYQFDVEI